MTAREGEGDGWRGETVIYDEGNNEVSAARRPPPSPLPALPSCSRHASLPGQNEVSAGHYLHWPVHTRAAADFGRGITSSAEAAAEGLLTSGYSPARVRRDDAVAHDTYWHGAGAGEGQQRDRAGSERERLVLALASLLSQTTEAAARFSSCRSSPPFPRLLPPPPSPASFLRLLPPPPSPYPCAPSSSTIH